jgi:hypothetical protein
MSNRELRATIRQRFAMLRAAIKQRRTELTTEAEAHCSNSAESQTSEPTSCNPAPHIAAVNGRWDRRPYDLGFMAFGLTDLRNPQDHHNEEWRTREHGSPDHR